MKYFGLIIYFSVILHNMGIAQNFNGVSHNFQGYPYYHDFIDFDDDGDDDAISFGYNNGSLVYYYQENLGNFQFSQVEDSITGLGGYDFGTQLRAFSDLDNDGNMDFMFREIVLTNNGNLNFTAIPHNLSLNNFRIVDFNNDGMPDVVDVNQYGNSPATVIYRNTGNYQFQEVFRDTSFYYFVVDDYDKDGDFDLVTLSFGGGIQGVGLKEITLLLNEGNFQFSRDNIDPSLIRFYDNQNFEGIQIYQFGLADFDNDGDLDAQASGIKKVITNSNIELFTAVLENGTYPVVVDSLTGFQYATDEIYSDFDHDGDMDFFLLGTVRDIETVQKRAAIFFENDGAGNFTEHQNIFEVIPSGGNVLGGTPSMADLDGDNDREIMYTSNDDLLSLYHFIYRNDNGSNNPPSPPGSIQVTASDCNAGEITVSWSPATDSETPGFNLSYALKVGTSPGAMDIISPLIYQSGSIFDQLTGIRSTSTTISGLSITDTIYISVQAIDGSGAKSAFSNELMYHFETSDFTIQATGLDASSETVEWGDYNGDGYLDIISSGHNTPRVFIPPYEKQTFLYEGSGSGYNPISGNLPSLSSSEMIWGDMDGDGDLDILANGVDTSGTQVVAVFRNDRGTFTRKDVPVTRDVHDVEWYDYDNNGLLDVVITFSILNLSGDILQVYLQSGEGYNSPSITYQDNTFVSPSVVVFNADNSAGKDFFLYGYDDPFSPTPYSKLLVNDGGNITGVQTSIPGIGEESIVKVKDFNNDGLQDLLVLSNNNSNNIYRIYLNDPQDPFQNFIGLGSIDGKVLDAESADFNNDGYPDIMIAYSSGEGVRYLYLENDQMNFTGLCTDFPDNHEYSGEMDLADYDQDGDMDVLINGYNPMESANRLYILENTTTNSNTLPSPPTNLTTSIVCGTGFLSWDPGTDGETNNQNLQYRLTLEDLSDSSVIHIEGINNNGILHFDDNHFTRDTTRSLNRYLEPGDYAWTVATVDGTGGISAFAIPDTFTVGIDSLSTFTAAPLSIFNRMAYKGTGLYPADYDNDGDYDLLVGGSIIADPDAPTSAVLHENVNGDFQPILALPAYYHPTQEPWLDINHDGYLDLMIGNLEDTTRSEPQIFINDKGNGFNEDPDFFSFFPNRRSVSMEMNNILFDGYTSMRISPATNPDDRLTLYSLSVGYRNNDSIAISSGISSSAIGFSFYNEMNNEEDMDRLVMTNSYLSTNFSQLVRFNAADYHPHIDMADINNDDYNDLVISNIEENGAPVVKIFEFAPDSLENGLYTFREVLSIPNAGLNGFAKFLDFDNDGDYDLIVDGENGSGTFLKKIYINENGIFNFLRCFPGNTNTTMAFFDIDGDDDADYVQIGARPGENGLKAVSEKYINSSSNQPPEPPVINSIEFNECYDKMVVHWDGPGDPDGPDEAITYDIKVGTSPGKGDIVTFQEKPGRGRLAETTQWTIHRIQPNTTYYVSIRSIDIHGIASASTETVVTSPPADNTFSFSQSYRHPESNYEIPRHFNFYDFAGDPTLDLIGLITSKDITALHHRSDILFDAAGFNDTINSTNKYMVEHISRYYSNRLENIFGYTTVKDFNYDGLLDIKTLSNETNPARDIIHQNNGDGSFTKIDLEGRVNANSPREILYPFDMDNDGDLDMFNGTEIYENTGSSYSLVSEFPVSENDELIILNTFDYNNDGIQDLLTYVFDSTNHFDINAEASIDIYRNEGNLSFSKAATLEQNPIGYFMDYEINDMNNDGYPDILLSMNSGIGITNTVEYNLNLYTNLHESNFDKHTILETPTHLKTTTGDIDQDGWTDIVMFNSKSNYLSSSMVTFYRNMGGNNFEETWCSDQGYFLRQPGGYVFDHNNNGRMDIVAFFYRNRDDYMNYNINSIGLHEFNPGNVNTDPSYPVGIQSYYNDTTGYLYLTWNRGRDSETTSNAMSYAIKVGDTPGIYNLKTAAAHHSGLRKNLQQGNLNNSNVFRFKADPMDTLYYAIQSIDQGYKGSPFTAEQMIVAQPGNNTISGNILTNTAGNKGKIIIKNEGHELPGTMVYLVDSASGSYIRSATADKDGNFNFLRVPDGSYRLEILFGDLQMSDEIPFIDVDNSESISVEVTVENDGISYTYDKSDVSTDIDQPEGISAIRFYPNPASGWINIHMERADETGKKILVKAFNQTGMEIYSSLMSNTLHTVNISGWNPGIYLFHIYSKKGLVIRAEKMIVY